MASSSCQLRLLHKIIACPRKPTSEPVRIPFVFLFFFSAVCERERWGREERGGGASQPASDLSHPARGCEHPRQKLFLLFSPLQTQMLRLCFCAGAEVVALFLVTFLLRLSCITHTFDRDLDVHEELLRWIVLYISAP